jgi:DNA-directed RNA polymerase specialized sigma24 family protein
MPPAVVAVRIADLRAALDRLDDGSRSLLELSVRRGLPDEEVGRALGLEHTEVATRRLELLEQLASELRLESREQRDELYATLPDLPDSCWQGAQAARA